MPFEPITDADLQNKGVTFLPDVPGLAAEQMKRKFEEIVRDVVIPRLNEIAQGVYTAEETKAVVADVAGEVSAEVARRIIEQELLPAVSGQVTQMGAEVLARAQQMMDAAAQAIYMRADGMMQSAKNDMQLIMGLGRQQIEDMLDQGVMVYDQLAGVKNPVEVALGNIVEWIKALYGYVPITPEEFAAMGITPEEFAAMNIDPRDFALNGKYILMGGANG